MRLNHWRAWLMVIICGYVVPARADMPVVRELHPDLTITFSESVPAPYNQMYSHAFIVREDGLTALLFSSDRAVQPHQALVTFNRAGTFKQIVGVTSRQLYSDWLQIGPNGTVLARAYGPRGAGSIVSINAAGDTTPILLFNERLLGVAMSGGTADCGISFNGWSAANRNGDRLYQSIALGRNYITAHSHQYTPERASGRT